MNTQIDWLVGWLVGWLVFIAYQHLLVFISKFFVFFLFFFFFFEARGYKGFVSE